MNLLRVIRIILSIYVVLGSIVTELVWSPRTVTSAVFALFAIIAAPLTILSLLLFAFAVYMKCSSEKHDPDQPINNDNVIIFNDGEFAKKYKGRKIPINVAIEAYMNQKIDFADDLFTVLKNHRLELFRFIITWSHVSYFLMVLIPQALYHSKSMDDNEVTSVYNRGNDFYNWFLGDSMVYTSGIYTSPNDSLEAAQERKMNNICKKLNLTSEHKLLDIGCGWGSLVRHATKRFGAKTLGITICQKQIDWAHEHIEKDGISSNCEVQMMDYRDLPLQKWDRISCIEMAEHVGVLRFQEFMLLVKERLNDDGLFFLQIAGLRRRWQFEDLCWGMFMGTYIFPAADASCPLGWVVSQLETAGFEVQSIENIGVHYSITLKQWYKNWTANRQNIVNKYGEWWYRLWSFFLSWSSIIAGQGSSTCWQIVSHKNLNTTDRMQNITGESSGSSIAA